MQDYILEPPLYFAQEHIFDISFHPNQTVLACCQVSGVVNLLKYSSEDVVEIANFTHHKESARVSQFFPDGKHLLTASKDCSFAILDQNGQLLVQKENAHKAPINVAKPLETLLLTGDDEGAIKIWDLRTMNCVYKVQENEDAITGFQVEQSYNLLLSSSLDGYLCVFDLRLSSNDKKALYAKSDCMEEDLTEISLVKNNRFVCTSTSEGNLLLFKWDYFGDFKDRIIGHPNSIDTFVKIDEHTIITGGEDGLVRGVSVFPNQIIGVLGQHEEDQYYPITKLAVDSTKQIAASISHDNSIKFHDISAFVKRRTTDKVWTNEDEFVFQNQRKEQVEVEDEDDDSDDDDEDSEDSDDQKQKQFKSKKTQNLKSSIQNLKKQKLKKFFDKL